MNQTIHALGHILLNAVPTFLIVGFLVLFLRAFYFKPFEKVSDERFAATEGAQQAAAKKMEDAERRVAEFEEKLRAARNDIYTQQEQAVKAIEAGQAASMDAVRRESAAAIERAKAEIGARSEEARQSFETLAGELADQIADRVLQGRAA